MPDVARIPFNTPRVEFGAIPRPAFGRHAQHQAEPAAATPAATATPTAKRTRSTARYMRAAQVAAELLPEIPKKGEAVHCLMLGTFDLCQVIAATVKILPACRHLRIATLCFSKRNAAELLGLLEERPTLRLTLLVSSFFKGHNKAEFEKMQEDLAEYADRAKLAAARSHCKVVCFEIGAKDGLVFEGSANLRTNGNREQLAAIRDAGLHDWHAGWIDEQVKAHGGKAEVFSADTAK